MAGDLVAGTARWTLLVRDSRRHIYTTAKSVAHPDGGAAQSNSPHPQPANYPIFCALSAGHRQICKPAFQTATNVLADLLPNTERRIKTAACLISIDTTLNLCQSDDKCSIYILFIISNNTIVCTVVRYIYHCLLT